MRRLITILCGVLLVSSPPVRAERPALDRPWLSPPREERLAQSEAQADLGDLDARIADLKARRDQIQRRGPTAGVITGGVLTGIGAATLSLNFLCQFDLNNRDRDSDCQPGWIAGGVLTGVGLIVLGSSATVLGKRNRQRKALGREIEALESSRAARVGSSFSVGFEAGDRKGVRLAWRY
jgi:hypothetical protein